MKALFLAISMAVIGAVGFLALHRSPVPVEGAETVVVPAGSVAWTPLGNFSRGGKTRAPRAVTVAVPEFEIMKYQVSRADYAACVDDGACAVLKGEGGALPRTGVSWRDATAYARWYSRQTGQVWRLPTETEWQRGAAERYGDAEAGPEAADPGERMLARYERGRLLRGSASARLRSPGGFGENTLGIADIGGNVWEWTDGCFRNGTLLADGSVLESEPYCGVRIAGGPHRAAIVDFVRDASVGGCAVGLPPDHLGFRLVRDRRTEGPGSPGQTGL